MIFLPHLHHHYHCHHQSQSSATGLHHQSTTASGAAGTLATTPAPPLDPRCGWFPSRPAKAVFAPRTLRNGPWTPYGTRVYRDISFPTLSSHLACCMHGSALNLFVHLPPPPPPVEDTQLEEKRDSSACGWDRTKNEPAQSSGRG